MLLNEIINEVGMTKRAVKYYEEKGLLSVDKDNNGYRNYTAQEMFETLKRFQYIENSVLVLKTYRVFWKLATKVFFFVFIKKKCRKKVLKDSELEALKQFIDDGDADKANEALDYQTVENAIESLLTGKRMGRLF